MLKRNSRIISCTEIEKNIKDYKRKVMNHWTIHHIIGR